MGLSKSDLYTPSTLTYYNSDGFKMPAALGSSQAELTYGTLLCIGWIDVQNFLGTPLLSWEHCGDSVIVPENFPQQIKTGNWVKSSTSVRPDGSTQNCG